MGNKNSKKKKSKEVKTLFMGNEPMSKGGFSDDTVQPPSRVNVDPQFLAGKEEQYATCMQLINEEINDPFNERAFGCIIGAFVGDSCGSYVEFDEKPASDIKVDNCMKMLGGGYHEIAPGQVTDDSEMMMSLMLGYIKSNENVAEDE